MDFRRTGDFLRKRLMVLAFPFSLLLVSCERNASCPPPVIDGSLAMTAAEEQISVGSRFSGSEGAEKACGMIADRLKKLPSCTTTVLEFSEFVPAGKTTLRNVIADFKGRKDDFYLIGAHYDTKKLETVPDFAGANDGASGVGQLVAMAKAVNDYVEKGGSLPLGIRFVFFDGEECFYKYCANDGLRGSTYYASRLAENGEKTNCRGVFILDMTGDKDLTVMTGGDSDEKMLSYVLEGADVYFCRNNFARYDGAFIDDHTPFSKAGIPVVDLIDFEYGKNNMYWHTREDTVDKISAESMKKVADCVLYAVWKLSEND